MSLAVDVRLVTWRSAARAMDGLAPQEVPVEVQPQDPGTGVNTANTARNSSVPDALTNTAMDTSHYNGHIYPDILRLIFRYLDIPDRGRAAQVCRDWKDVAYERSIWRGVEVKLRLPDFSPSLYGTLSRRGISRIKVMRLNGGLRELLRTLHGLTSLDLSECYNISDSCIVESLSEQLPSLVCLNLSGCSQVTDVSVSCITKFLPNLEHLNLEACGNITNAGMTCIASNLHFLKCLQLKKCNVSDVALKRLAGIPGRNTPSDTSKRLGVKELRHLVLESCYQVSVNGLKYLSVGLKSLVSLDLSMCPVNDECLEHIAKIASLKKLTLYECENFTGQGILYLATARFRLNCLILSECQQIEDSGIQMITRGQGLLNLTTLSVDACPITNAGLSVVAERLRDLTTLNIAECESISEDGISAVAAHLRKLRSINMRLCTGLTDVSLKHLAMMPSLEVVNLMGCRKITGKGVALIASGQGPSSVLELDVSFTSIGDTDLRYISQGMQKLRSLSLCGCMISDKGLANIARKLQNLDTLKISLCSRITDSGIEEVACHMNRLRQIDMKGCSLVSSTAKRFLVVRQPQLKFL